MNVKRTVYLHGILYILAVLAGSGFAQADIADRPFGEVPDHFISRTCLVAIANEWFDAEPLISNNVRQTTNGEETFVILPASGLEERVFYCDEQKGQVSAWARNGDTLYQVRLSVRCDLITEIEVFDLAGEWFGNAERAGGHDPMTRQEMIDVANIYYDAYLDDALQPPFSDSIIRYENGVIVCADKAICHAQHTFFGAFLSNIRDRRWLIDIGRGNIMVYSVFEVNENKNVTISCVERFYINEGMIQDMNTYWVADPRLIEIAFRIIEEFDELPPNIKEIVDEMLSQYTFEMIDPEWQPGAVIPAENCTNKVICDLDNDGDVDRQDRDVLRRAYGAHMNDAGYRRKADLDRDGDIDFFDYQLWYARYKKENK